MSAAADLKAAAFQSFSDLRVLWAANTLKTKVGAFCTTLFPLVPEQGPNNHPISNWGVLINAAQKQLPASNVSFLDLVNIADYMYRLCWVAYYLQHTTPALITPAQATAILADYNSNFT